MSIYTNLIRRKALLFALLLCATFCNCSQMEETMVGPLSYHGYLREQYPNLNSTEHPEVTHSKHPRVEAMIMPLCHALNTRNGACAIDDISALYRSDVLINL